MKKALLVVLALVLVAALSVGLTMAFLQDETDVVTNTFTVGNVAITLDEAKVTEYGVEVENADRVTRNDYKLIPNQEYVKDPTIHVAADSEECWLFVKIENNLASVEPEDGSIADQMSANWTLIDEANGIYAYNSKVTGSQDVVVFNFFRVVGEADLANLDDDATIEITAYAVQAAGFGTVQAAWNNTFGK